jgi:hypothetical protein
MIFAHTTSQDSAGFHAQAPAFTYEKRDTHALGWRVKNSESLGVERDDASWCCMADQI